MKFPHDVVDDNVVMSDFSDIHSVLICFGEVWNGFRFR